MTISRLSSNSIANVINVPWAQVSGGTVTTYTNSNGWLMSVHSFTTTGTLTVAYPGYAELLVCGAGAGGQSGSFPSSGGGGGVRFGMFYLPGGNHTATVPAAPAAATSGGAASLGTVLSVGGGFHNIQPSGVNCGGGGGCPSNGNTSGSGGGGAGGSGNNTDPGPGIVSTITGSSVEYGKGGDLNVDPTLPGQGGKQGLFPGSAGIVIVAVRIG